MRKNIIVIILLVILLNPLSLYFLYGSCRIATEIVIDLITTKREAYFNKCDIEKTICGSKKDEKEKISNCEYENTRNCKCYKCISVFNFDSCAQCYMPTTKESFCVKNECVIPAFP